jgi:hypothetical protein
VVFKHERCEGRIQQQLNCTACGETPRLTEVIARRTNSSRAKRERAAPR